ncbi:hypothetical protein GCM10009780_65830 [Actinomadura alba]
MPRKPPARLPGSSVLPGGLYAAGMVALLDPRRECHCVLCTGDDPGHDHDDGQVCEHGCRDDTADLVARHGWSATAVHSDDGVPAWAYTIGMWHSLGSPEVAMFGLLLPDMQNWINKIGDQIRDGQPLHSDERPLHGILPGGYPLIIKPVHPGWYPFYFGTALRFYRHHPPLPIVQVVWPDQDGRFPWDEHAGVNCRANQPQLWLPPDQHAPSLWRELESITPWPFPDSPVRTQVYTTTRIIDGQQPIRGVVRDHDGAWQFLDGLDTTGQSIAIAHLHHVYAQHPYLAQFATLAPGRQAWLSTDGTWTLSDLDPEDKPAEDG